MSKAPVVIFDIDDTLADWQSARTDGHTYFAAAADGVMAPKPEMVALAHEYMAHGVEVVALTARPALLHDATVAWITEHVGNVTVIMTTDSKRRKDHETKALLLATLSDREIIAAYDDKPENVTMFTEHGITAHLV